MRQRGWADPKSVYLDNVAMRYEAGSEISPRGHGPEASEEERAFRAAHHDMIQIGARHADWWAMYRRAVDTASCMIVVLTDAWLDSIRNTGKEFLAAEERATANAAFKRIAIKPAPSQGTSAAASIFAGNGWEVLSTSRVTNHQGSLAGAPDSAEISAHEGAWTIPENDLSRLLARI